jgi:hypothetical protein
MKRKVFLLGGFLFIVASSIFFACSKDAEENKVSIITKSSEGEISSEEILIGIMKEGDLEPTLSFDKEEYAKLITEKIEMELGNDYIFEDISIEDEYPFDMDSIAVLKHTIFNIETGETMNSFLFLDKRINNDGVVIFYVKDEDSSLTRKIDCKGENCTNGCKLNDKKDGCTKCENPDGKCTADNKADITWKDCIGWGVTIIVGLVAIFV